MKTLGHAPGRHTYEQLLKNRDPDVFILTATQRLAAFLEREYALTQSSEGKSVWVKPMIFSFSNWLKRTWLEMRFSNEKLLLSSAQEHSLWQKIIHDSLKSSPNLAENAAKLASEALGLVDEWQLPFPFPAGMLSENVRIFQELATQFRNICHRKNWLTPSQLPDYLSQQFQAGYLAPPKKMILIGFANLNPAAEALLQTMQNAGTEIIYYTSDFSATDVNRFEAEHVETEILTMAHWAKETLQNSSSTPFIGCVVPKLEQRRSQVLNTFTRVFEGTEFSFALSAPIRFDTFSLITIALKLFSLGEESIGLLDLGLLLRTPFIGGAVEECVARATLENELKKLATDEILIDRLLELAGTIDKPFYCPLWRERVMTFRAKLLEIKGKLFFPSLFVEKFLDYLAILGWPGERQFTSDEIQIIQRFHQLFNEFARLDVICGQISWTQAKFQLESLIKQILFQPRLDESAPVQIVGTLEPMGMLFTHLWVFGLNDEVWPPTPQPHPFIPLDLQCQFNLPHSSSMKELAFSEHLTHQFCQMASTVIFSSSRQDGDIRQRPSPLLRQFFPIEMGQLGLGPMPLSIEEHCLNADQFEYWVDENAPKISLDMPIKGGSYLFELQSACPFRAFAEIRLCAKTLEKTRSHLNARERGSLLHRVLELVWKDLKSHKNLLNRTKESIHQLIETNVKLAVEEMCDEQWGKVKSGFHRIEETRLINRVKQWLFLKETIRPAFDVLAIESAQQIEVDGRTLRLKVDRIDELCADKKKVIIDYKTGFSAKDDWMGERLNKPQLPLYCVTSKVPVDGILFAQVKSGDMMFKGLAQEGVEIDGVDTLSAQDWRELQSEWKIALEKLFLQFTEGYANVDPKEGEKTCRFCELKLFCRVGERN